MLTTNPYKDRKLTIEEDCESSKEAEMAPIFFPDELGAPTPRHSEYISNPALSQKLRREVDAQILSKVTKYARPIRIKTKFKTDTVQRFKNNLPPDILLVKK